MIKITIEHFASSAEVISYEKTADGFIEYLFKPCCDGFISIMDESYKVKGGVCVIEASKLKDTEIFPTLILPECKIPLPALSCEDDGYKIKAYDGDYLRKLSLNQLRMTKRLCQLEEKVDKLSKKVYNTTIF